MKTKRTYERILHNNFEYRSVHDIRDTRYTYTVLVVDRLVADTDRLHANNFLKQSVNALFASSARLLTINTNI